ncbi:hypothetical protein P6709_18010 [Jeotgalibacillus sp. ET6]|uniref:hypothetical protein n=1 Tax=Jeotgalibacillus sp. ET6 TaxID=3037260 RepID=UPI00241875F8|nr:hypothetical protein [Jeotgalibacillus sp. ET6]MDG5473626.1 hypothetical protein [Jeotgalibacillus sp. ET6]
MEINEAYKIFNCSEESTDEEIDRHYFMWIKKEKASRNNPDANDPIDLEIINHAYETIKKHREHGTLPPNDSKTLRAKVEHFFTYYKLQTLGILVLIIVSVAAFQTILDQRQEQAELNSLPKESVSIMFYGSYFEPGLAASEKDENKIVENILTAFPEWERITTTLNYSPHELTDGSDIGIQQKSAAILALEKPDLYIMDLDYFNLHAPSGMFHPLNELESGGETSRLLHYAQTGEDGKEQLYGIELTNESLFNGVPVHDQTRKIAAIRKDSGNKENALAFMKEFSGQ